MKTKLCLKCKRTKPVQDFSPRGDGWFSWCKVCRRSYYANLKKPKEFCACGCGKKTRNKFLNGHNTRKLTRKEQSRRGRQNDGSKQRDRGAGKWYRKFRGQHEHRLVMERKLGRPLKSNEIVHHKDRNVRNNNLSNLVLTTRAKHAAHHWRGEKI